MEGSYLQVARLTATGAMDLIPADGNAALIWGFILYHTALSLAQVSISGTDIVDLGTSGAGSTGAMFSIPIYTQVEPNVDAITASAILYVYYQTTGSK